MAAAILELLQTSLQPPICPSFAAKTNTMLHNSPPGGSGEQNQKLKFNITPEMAAEFRGCKHEVAANTIMETGLLQMPCLVEPFLQQTGLACLAGSSDTGKSTFLRQLALAIVAGDTDFLGFKLNTRHRSVLYVSTEDDQVALNYLLNQQAWNYRTEQMQQLRFIFEYEDLLLKLDESLTNCPADVVPIDCFADSFSEDLKDTQKIRTFLSAFQQLAVKHQCLILFLHHTLKRSEHREPSKNNLLAGQGFEAKMRLVMELRADLSNPNHRHLCIVTGNYLSAIHKKESYVLHFNEQEFSFTNTNERVPFELLAKAEESDEGKAQFEQLQDLLINGKMSYQQAAEAMGFASKGSVTKILSKARKKGWLKE